MTPDKYIVIAKSYDGEPGIEFADSAYPTLHEALTRFLEMRDEVKNNGSFVLPVTIEKIENY